MLATIHRYYTLDRLEKYTKNIHIHHLPPGCKVSLQQSVGGAEASIVDANIDSAQVWMGFYPGEQRSNVLLLCQVTLAVIKLNKIDIKMSKMSDY